MKFLNFAILTLLLTFSGCASTNPDGTPRQVQPMQPIEAQHLATAMMAVALESKKNLDVEELKKVGLLLEDSRQLLVATLDDDPSTFPQVGHGFVEGVKPAYRNLINAVVGVLIIRLQPTLDQGKTALAAEYVNAVLIGAQIAVKDQIDFLEPPADSTSRLRAEAYLGEPWPVIK